MDTVKSALQVVQARIATAIQAAGREPGCVELLAVSKTFPAAAVAAAANAGQRAFGESYVQEALPKLAALRDLSLTWHFIGPLQRNKTQAVAQHFDWVHSVDRLIIAQRLNDARPASMPPLNICLQVNISEETSKSGVTPDGLSALAHAAAALPRLRLRGLMAIPRGGVDAATQHAQFARLRALQTELIALGMPLDTLSMGMSDDLEIAIAEGATLVRVGSALFGTRLIPIH
ncbi:YggS family pyridoxal phosphate-dependent enzyme [Sulfuriferula sp.]|uniref:YggS family pyridoxal phosphate-dependent enzyme n=1 Tax=Sulfuriferula sp. TaxID=2025307 RepID=UPI002730523A|nr:YggS family pyridoxal phosphate-dependent enzyme [Sulfuriferula sp.]MDP2025066.1 YggS family pyridoxal phosphate-dependent enzyme [Sulfuriferula sp.]